MCCLIASQQQVCRHADCVVLSLCHRFLKAVRQGEKLSAEGDPIGDSLQGLVSLELQLEALMLLSQGAQLLLHFLILAHQGSLHDFMP